MTQASLQLMKTFLKNLDGNDWNRLQPFHVKSLRSLQHLKIDTALLHAAATFWDPKDHVFIFNSQELCPLIEEFAAILGCSLDSIAMVALPDLDMQIPHRLITFFDMPPDTIYSSLLPSGFLNLSSLLTACEAKDKNTPAWVRTVFFCLYAQFLLVSSKGDANMRIVSIIEQVETGNNPMPVILAETLIGLDSFKEENRLSGSLLLLQVCNQNLFIFI